jgi:hypothetical protein
VFALQTRESVVNIEQNCMNAHRKVVGCCLGGTLACDEPAPCLVAFVDDLGGVLLVLCLARERKDVLGLAVRDLVDTVKLVHSEYMRFGQGSCDIPEPFVGGTDETREVVLDVLNVVQLACKRVVDVDYDNLPVGLALVEKGHNAEDLDLLDLANISNLLTDLTDIQGIVVTLCLGLRVHLLGIFPCLEKSRDM